mmetsp:Transcript_45938/g.139260  ORF Transcript_45938/g.139260 Transcript_45938/m.139260 type:complete len:334 (-) Transcript_45938:10-1011(-)
MIVTGIILEVIAALLGTISKQLIACSSRNRRRWLFHLGAFMNIVVGPIVDASAYAYAPQVVIAPFASLDVVFNMLSAPCTLRWQQERITREHVMGTVLVATGAAFTALAGAVRDEQLDVYELEKQLTRSASLWYMGLELLCLAGVALSLKGRRLRQDLRGIALGTCAGVLMGNVFFMKGFLGILVTSGNEGSLEAFGRPTPYLVLAAAVAGSLLGHLFMRKGLAEYKGVFMVTIFEGAHITAACLSGCVVMSELKGCPWWRFCAYWSAVGLIVCGILIVNRAAGTRLSSPSTNSTNDSALRSPVSGASFEAGRDCTPTIGHNINAGSFPLQTQ